MQPKRMGISGRTLKRFKKNHTSIASVTEQLKIELRTEVELLLSRVIELTEFIDGLHTALGKGDFNSVHQALVSNPRQPVRYDRLLSKLRGARFDGAPLTANLVADIHMVSSVLRSLEQSIGARTVAVLAAAGEGKSELAVKVTQPEGEYPGESSYWVRIFIQVKGLMIS